MLACHPPAKLNLGLHVLRRRADGYHDIETVLLPIGWCDTLTAERAASGTITLTCSEPELPTDGRNLVVRAAHALQAWASDHAFDPWTLGARLHLTKAIPFGAGLGGGSSDAAHALRLLNDLWDLGATTADLHPLAAKLGADVPFFLYDAPMLATETGTTLAPFGEGDAPYRCPFSLVVAMPDVQVATAHAYRLVTPSGAHRPDLADLVRSNDLDGWRRNLTNDFEAPILARSPAIAAAKQALLDAGAGYAAMTGSGAAVFGAFKDDVAAVAAAETLRASAHRVWWSTAP